MAIEFLSDEWEATMQEKLATEFSRRGLITTRFVQIMTECPDGTQKWTLTEIKKGRYVNYQVGTGEPPEYEIAAQGTFEAHRGIIKGELDSESLITSGGMKLLGNMAKGITLLGTYNRIEEAEKTIDLK